MQMSMTVVLMVQIIAALVMSGLILVQHGKGADMGAAFGSGSAGSLFGASGSANFLSRMTAVAATVFFASTLLMAFMASSGMQRTPDESGGASVFDSAVPLTAPQPDNAASSAIPGADGSVLAPVATPNASTAEAEKAPAQPPAEQPAAGDKPAEAASAQTAEPQAPAANTADGKPAAAAAEEAKP
ncbi:preprotein translocase subunit SecG [Allofranklinella schreckenbergeri]|uniref:Protein-export membrane protein SecG n=1 Tax=Allofranklinella schreckenbergeri TaxID=1076744 RepID=A0A3M6R4Y7_9BURK|nr:preprotein translocase subunit SecG [Allofranklinella schreckenbergeri]RMX10332.1 preprotein translocase subunit SecG [Allofranklinella schreckenbergeri]RRD41990.1 preprotein translocase subunit SecG [Comamonadaceae bacterium OH3737_COT-264]